MSVFLTELIVVFKDLEFIRGNNSGISISNLLDQGQENTKSIGLFLYTDFFIIFQISGYLLLVAMIGAIVLAYDNQLSIKSQSILKQKQVKKDDIIKLKYFNDICKLSNFIFNNIFNWLSWNFHK